MRSPVSSLCVYCGSSVGQRDIYKQTAEQLGQLLAQSGIELVYGGGSLGLMGVTAQSCLAAGGKVTGIIPNFLDKLEVGMEGLTKLIKTDNMHQRKSKMAELSDGFIIMPGGLGTLDETFEILTWRQLKLHDKPIILLNIDGYWDLFVHLLEHQVNEGFVKSENLSLFRVVNSIDGILPALSEDAGHGGDVKTGWT